MVARKLPLKPVDDHFLVRASGQVWGGPERGYCCCHYTEAGKCEQSAFQINSVTYGPAVDLLWLIHTHKQNTQYATPALPRCRLETLLWGNVHATVSGPGVTNTVPAGTMAPARTT